MSNPSETLCVERNNPAWGWSVNHVRSGKHLLPDGLRLRKFAVEAMNELLATGVDWSKPDDELGEEDRKLSIAVWMKWANRARAENLDEETGEWYPNSSTTRLLSTPDGSLKRWGAPNPAQAAEYRARRVAEAAEAA